MLSTASFVNGVLPRSPSQCGWAAAWAAGFSATALFSPWSHGPTRFLTQYLHQLQHSHKVNEISQGRTFIKFTSQTKSGRGPFKIKLDHIQAFWYIIWNRSMFYLLIYLFITCMIETVWHVIISTCGHALFYMCCHVGRDSFISEWLKEWTDISDLIWPSTCLSNWLWCFNFDGTLALLLTYMYATWQLIHQSLVNRDRIKSKSLQPPVFFFSVWHPLWHIHAASSHRQFGVPVDHL